VRLTSVVTGEYERCGVADEYNVDDDDNDGDVVPMTSMVWR
jgi:hypothetical protein